MPDTLFKQERGERVGGREIFSMQLNKRLLFSWRWINNKVMVTHGVALLCMHHQSQKMRLYRYTRLLIYPPKDGAILERL